MVKKIITKSSQEESGYLKIKEGLWSNDPQILMTQIVYHFAHLDKENKVNTKFRSIFLPPLSFLYSGVMQAQGFSLLTQKADKLVFVFQGDHEGSVFVPKSLNTTPLLGKRYSIVEKLYTEIESSGFDIVADDTKFEKLNAMWFQMPFVRVGTGIDSIAPMILPVDFDKELMSDMFTDFYDKHTDTVFIFVGELSSSNKVERTRKNDELILTDCLLGKPLKGFHNAPLLQLYCNVSQKLGLTPTHVNYEDSLTLGYSEEVITGYVVSGY